VCVVCTLSLRGRLCINVNETVMLILSLPPNPKIF
jgi:hypothetical protein